MPTPDKFRPPYRILRVYEQFKVHAELQDCTITIEELPGDGEAGYFPVLTFDSSRVFVRLNDFAINVVGRLTDSNFDYQVNVYEAHTPSGLQYSFPIDKVDEMVDVVVARIAEKRNP